MDFILAVFFCTLSLIFISFPLFFPAILSKFKFRGDKTLRWLIQTFTSSIGKKIIVAITGLGLLIYLILHLFGNLHLYTSHDLFNHYAEGLRETSWLIYAEIALLLAFVIHIILIINLSSENRKARGKAHYSVTSSKRPEKALSLSSRTMLISGIIVLVFLIVHILDYRWKITKIEDLAMAVVTSLVIPWRALLYMAGSLLVGWHLFHGIQSAFRSLGINHPKYTPIIEKVGILLSVILGLGFASFPLLIWIGMVK